MNKGIRAASKGRSMISLTRRTWLTGAAAVVGATCCPGLALARRAALVVEVPNNAIGALVAAVAGDRVEIRLLRTLGPVALTVGGKPIDIGHRILLKGQNEARGRFLDDARNAPKLGANIRDALSAADPDGATAYAANHRAWSRPFAHRVIAWTKDLGASKVHGRRVPDPYGRAALLEWAGATIAPAGPVACPVALATVAAEPEAATPAAYERYVQALVDALR